MKTYVRYGVILLAALIVGAVLGIGIGYVDIGELGRLGVGFVHLIRQYMLPIMLVLMVVGVLTGEMILRKIRILGEELEKAEEEESDRIETDLERFGAIGTVAKTLLNVLSILVLSTGYSIEYIAELRGGEARLLLTAMVIFVLDFVYSGYWGVRFVRKVQKIHPEKKGDPSTRRFTKEWLASCDEAEQEKIYRAAYSSYYAAMKLMPMLMVLAMIFHLLWNTGIMAVALIGIVWVAMTVTYGKNCMGT